jgi:hypothetical protein
MRFLRPDFLAATESRPDFAAVKTAVETLFRIAQWIVLIGVLRYFAVRTHSDYIDIASNSLYALLAIYTFYWLAIVIDVDLLPRKLKFRTRLMSSDDLISAAITFALFGLISHSVNAAVAAIMEAQGLH